MKLIVGTDKGLLVYEWLGNNWTLMDIQFVGLPIGSFHLTNQGHWWVAINHKHWGPKLYQSSNEGQDYREVPVPAFDSHQSLKSIWTIESDFTESKEKLYIGTEPAALFVSDDQGQSFVELKGLSEHPSRATWQGGGKGSKDPFLHSVLIDPRNPNELLVGISCAGIFKSQDAGRSWTAHNQGLEAFFLPSSEVEVGHDPHSIKRHPINQDIIWQQNHCGIYRSDDNGDTWQNSSDPAGEASYGFDIAISEKDIDQAWVIPAQSDDHRIPNNNQLAVYTTNNAGQSWRALRDGLPQEAAFDMVLRDGLDKKGLHMAFGTNNGNLYVSRDEGQHWQSITNSLSTIRLVQFI
jgi:photosystem II stability/assembly factor-like uncharacterized protein